MILVSGVMADPMIELMCARLRHMEKPYFFLDHAKFPREIGLSWRREGAMIHGTASNGDQRVQLEELTGVYARYVTSMRKPELGLSVDETHAAGR